MTKKTLLIFSGIGAGMFLILLSLVLRNGCQDKFFFCRDQTLWLIDLLRFFPILFILSLVTYKLRDEIFRMWIRFAQWFLAISVALILIAPNTSTDWMFPNDKGRISFFLSILFFLISLIIIGIKSVFVYRKK